MLGRRALILILAAGGCRLASPDTDAVTRSEGELSAAVNILTQHNDPSRTGLNPAEKVLTPASVSSGRFGKLWSRDVDGQVYAQPLFVSGQGGGDMVLVATEHNSVYAFDAAGRSQEPVWTTNLGPSVPATDVQCRDLEPEIGITSTPVIDLPSRTIFVAAKTKEGDRYVHRLHAIDLSSGRDKPGSPVEISATVPGTGVGSVQGQLSFDPKIQLNRPGLLLLNGVVYLAFASHCDVGAYHGWVFGYDATTLEPRGVHVTTPGGEKGGIWQGGVGLTAGAHDLYYVAGNGTYDGTTNFGEGIVRLVPSDSQADSPAHELGVGTSFAPFGTDALDADDVDIGSVGALLVPDSNLLVTADKAGNFYVVRRDQMGGREPNDAQIVQKFRGTVRAAFGGFAFFDKTLYAWGASDVLKAYRFDGSKFDTNPRTNPAAHAGERGGQISVSSEGASGGIVWTVRPGRGGVTDGAVEAFDASDISRRLWSSEDDDRDRLGALAKFAAPTVAAGKVFFGTAAKQLVVYGLRTGAEPDASAPDAGGTSDGGPVGPAPTFTEIFRDFLGPGTPGHCTSCHARSVGGFRCGTTKADCYAGLVAFGLISPQAPLQSLMIEDGASPVSWFGGTMPEDAPEPNERARAAVTAWVEAGARND
jgi:hypothetical protein